MGILDKDILSSIKKAADHQLSLQSDEGYWWYTLEANESICAEAIFLMHFMGEVDEAVQAGLARRILSCQRPDGTWALFYGGPPDLSTTIECYWALKLAGVRPRHQDTAMTSGTSAIVMEGSDPLASALSRARDFILTSGGITRARVFTKIHLAQFGLIPWSACPAMPVELMLMPTWAPVNVYEFSSWARACIIPLLVVMNKKPVRPVDSTFTLNELFAEPPSERSWHYKTDKAFLSWDRFFIRLNKFLKLKEYIPNPLEGVALKKCEEWICEHIAKTEDIYPALAYGAMALSALGHPNSHPMIRKALNALKSFQQAYEGDDLPAIVCHCEQSDEAIPRTPCHCEERSDEVISRTQVNDGVRPRHQNATVVSSASTMASSADLNTSTLLHLNTAFIHQQCCISPVWDTPWQITALLEAGVPPNHPALLKSGRWLISKQITKTYGDWKFKNPDAKPGGWSFEFENEFFPDVDDTIQVLHVLNRLSLPGAEKRETIERGLKWLLSMQNDDGGWGAFDKNQTLELVNKIPFSDHGACLDPSSPDITARMVGLLGELAPSPLGGEGRGEGAILRAALSYLSRTQEPFGAWSGRWGVNYIYGTWCVLAGLAGLPVSQLTGSCHSRESLAPPNGWGGNLVHQIQTAANWLVSIQHEDGGWSEDPFSYKMQKYAPYPRCHCELAPQSGVSEAIPRTHRHCERSEAIPSDQLSSGDRHSPLQKGGERSIPPFVKGGQGRFGVPSQTTWALMGLIAARGIRPRYQDATMASNASAMSMKGSDPIGTSISRGIEFLIERLKDDGTWDEKEFTGTGFPNHFYIRYHGYRHFFPLLALGRYYRSNL